MSAEPVEQSGQPVDKPAEPEAAPKPKRRRRTKAQIEADRAAEAAALEAAKAAALAAGEPWPPKPKRTRRKKVAEPQSPEAEKEPMAPVASAEAPVSGVAAVAAEPVEKVTEGALARRAAEGAPRRRRRAPKATPVDDPTMVEATPREPEAHADHGDVAEMNRVTQEATHASSIPSPMPRTTLEASTSEGREEQGRHAEHAGREQDATEASQSPEAAQEPAGDAGDQSQHGGEQHNGEGHQRRRRQRNRNGNAQGNGPQSGQQGNQQNGQGNQGRYDNRNGQGNNRRRNRRNNQQEAPAQPTLTREELQAMKVAELRAKAGELGIDYIGVHKGDLVEAIYAAAARAEGFRTVDGILEIGNEGFGWVRTGNYMQGDDDAFVSQQMIRQNQLRPGDRLAGNVGPGRANSKYPPLISISTVNGRPPEEMRNRPRFRDLTPIYPNERLVMEHGKDSITGRAIDLVSPIGKGQRGLIVSPPKAGKTTVLKKICQSIAANNPEVHLFCLLVDERPEEVTDMERSIKGEVVASTFDMPAENHTSVSELVIEHAKRLVELGEDVVVVLDSITRLARAYNLAQPASGRILSGGVDSAALYPPKKFLGAARNIENGGSLTIIASALVDTGSKMDEVIFEEFKGTGNMELKLDRDLADKRIFPAIDPVASGTRNEELLLQPELTPFIWGIRRVLANMNNTERAATALVKGLKATGSNEEFLIRSAKKAQQQEYTL